MNEKEWGEWLKANLTIFVTVSGNDTNWKSVLPFYRQREKQRKEEEEQRKQEEEYKRQEADDCFQAWLRRKQEEGRKQRQEEDDKKRRDAKDDRVSSPFDTFMATIFIQLFMQFFMQLSMWLLQLLYSRYIYGHNFHTTFHLIFHATFYVTFAIIIQRLISIKGGAGLLFCNPEIAEVQVKLSDTTKPIRQIWIAM